MSKRSDPAAFARAAGAADPRPLAEPAPGHAPPPQGPNALAVPPPADVEDAFPPPEPYDPADYRWVPVRRKPRLDGWTEEKQRRFIETLADTGLVNVACKAVGMSRASAYQLRRSPHGAAFARAWDAARHHAGGLIEDIAFERAIEGTEQEVLGPNGEVIATRLVHDNRLLKYLLGHLKPERYGTRTPGAAPHGTATPQPADPPVLEQSLRAMEPALPAPPEQLLDPETLADELLVAEIADGVLPRFLSEQRTPKSDARLAAEEAAARDARGAEARKKHEAGGKLTDAEFADLCYHLDPVGNANPRCRPRQGT
ncbi:hypothetical protein MZO42_16825 [Sphingomonas psychrotolerans]|uniref:Terminase n=1 Tax=Sphingomonas psychrotolerans TaxID=1327635 RepID=A0ABU3N993_9SPHN|nr:hypothetical protein [Sphingomonas psychrotolerans]MDT8760367.1 hypothetical protein [Sphingomonas psychrotolerans]